MADPVEPTAKQIERCEGMGWECIGLGLFVKGDYVGYFAETGWHKIRQEHFK